MCVCVLMHGNTPEHVVSVFECWLVGKPYLGVAVSGVQDEGVDGGGGQQRVQLALY